MTINTINKKIFELLDENSKPAARMEYTNNSFDDAIIDGTEKYLLNGIATGIWISHLADDTTTIRLRSKIRVETGGIISIRLLHRKKKYLFKKSAGWRLRFSLVNKEGEDLLTLIPLVNWQKASHDFILQLNEEYENECDSFLILQAVHCANCSLSMMTGGEVPALVSI
jgi:hypothetical protein